MAIESVKVPDIGGSENVDVIEISVAVGDTVELDDSLVVLETDKASMEVPSTVAGVVKAIKVKEGDKVSEGDLIVDIETSEAVAAPEAPAEPAPAAVAEQPIIVPDLGGSDNVDVIEVCVAPGDVVAEGDALVVLESDKASMEVPAPAAGTIVSIALKEGDKVSQGDTLGMMTSASSAPAVAAEPAQASATAAPASVSVQDVPVPDIGGAEGVDVIEVSVAEGDEVAEGDTLIVLETDKASMEIPSPAAGKVVKLAVKEGDKVSQGDLICQLEGAVAAPAPAEKPQVAAAASAAPAPAPAPKTTSAGSPVTADSEVVASSSADVYAGPAVRKLARQLGADLAKVKGTGPRSRITKDDLRNYVKNIVTASQEGRTSGGSGIPAIPAVDFAKFGEIETVKMSKIKKITSDNMVRNWLNIPHVTQWDDADITELEAFRKSLKAEAEKRGTKLTPLPFLLKAAAAALVAEPSFNVSIHHDGEHIVQKKYVHIGVAVDTPNGLMVPVIRDVDKKGLWELADDFNALVKKARDGKLTAADMQGGCFTISSLGAMGGNGFTPIVNAPEVAILGVSKAQVKPVWNGKEFEPRNMLPLSLSYDHRAINGADAGRFFTYLTAVIADVRRLLL